MKTIKSMKWWGWGDANIEFDIDSRPALWPYLMKEIKLKELPEKIRVVNKETIILPKAKENAAFINSLTETLQAEQIKSDDQTRLAHTYGKSFRDLWRIRNSDIKRAPDCVVYPYSNQDVSNILRLAHQHNVVIIPFGGGTNIVGGVESLASEQRMIVVVSLRAIDEVIVNHDNMTAKIGAGILGPALEKKLNAEHVTLGHFPDSFEYSSLGGWVATRSAGMLSDHYGKIEDMVFALTMITPSGEIITREVPKASNGIDIKQLCIGSEGVLGIITEITMMVHPLPKYKAYYGFLFHDFTSGVEAVNHVIKKGVKPTMMRLSDAKKTQLSFVFKKRGKFTQRLLSRVTKWYLKKIKKIDLDTCCLMLIGCEAQDKKTFARQYNKVAKLFKQHHAIALGASPGRSFAKSKYDFPYTRDHLMDYGIVVDVSETATVWNNVLPLYHQTMDNIRQAIQKLDCEPWVGCHLSHSYHSGASLYFTFGFLPKHQDKVIEQYWQVKQAAEQSFIDGGATLSHHHAVGYEHAPWIADDIGNTGVDIVDTLKQKLDPNNIMNPGKYIRSQHDNYTKL
ncbi:MAG: FAD-binding oxidoreductase [Pseudomonadota bacterium]